MNAPTVQTHAAGEISIVDMPEPPRRKSVMPVAASFAVVLAIAIGAASMLRNHAQPAPQQPPAARKLESSVVALAPGHLGINAYPWATVTSIRDMRTGRNVIRDAPLVTPAPVDLAPGRYEITLSNPEFSQPIVKTVEIKSGQDQVLHVPFADAASLTVPHLTDSAQ
jgi:hypothetical protein